MPSESINTGMMQHKIRLNSKVSLAVILVDDFSPNDFPAGTLRVYLKEIPSCPTKNLSGYYVFTAIPEGVYTICVASEKYYFVQEVVELSRLNPYEPVIRIILKPNVQYPFPKDSTLIRATVRDLIDNPAHGAKVKSTLKTDFAARLSSKGTWDGDKDIDLVDIKRKIYAGDTFLINDEEEEKREYCRAYASMDGVVGLQNLKLSNPLKFKHMKGVQLLPVIETMTSDTGEMVVYFRNTFSKKFCILLEISYQDMILKREVQITEGANVSLGVICF